MGEIRFENEELNKFMENKTGKKQFTEEDIERKMRWRTY